MKTVCNNFKWKFIKFDIEDEDPSDNYHRHNGRSHCEWDYLQIKWLTIDSNGTNIHSTGHLCHFVEKDGEYYEDQRGNRPGQWAPQIKDYDGNNPSDDYYTATEVCRINECLKEFKTIFFRLTLEGWFSVSKRINLKTFMDSS